MGFLLLLRLEVRVDDGAISGQRSGLDQFVVPVHGEPPLLALSIIVSMNENRLAPRRVRRRDAATRPCDVGVADDLDAIELDDFVGALRLRHCRRASIARSISTEPGFIDFTMSAVTSLGAGRPGISAVVMDDVLLLDMLGRSAPPAWPGTLSTFPWRSRRRSGAFLELLVLDLRGILAPSDFHLLLGGGPYVGRSDKRRRAGARVANRLQAGDGRRPSRTLLRAGKSWPAARHHHREGAAEGFGSLDYRAIAGEVGLRGQHVPSPARARDAPASISIAKRGDAGVRHRLQCGFIAVRIHDGDDQRAASVLREFQRLPAASHLDDDVGVP